MLLEDFFTSAGAALRRALPEDVSITFDVKGKGGGIWTVSRRGSHVRVVREEAPDADCRLTCTVDDFRRLLRGELDGREGFMNGRLAIEGDIGLLLDVQQVLVGR